MNSKLSIYFFVGSLLLAASSFVGSHKDIQVIGDLFLNVQNLFGFLGVIGGVLVGWVAKSPLSGSNGTVAKITGNGDQRVP